MAENHSSKIVVRKRKRVSADFYAWHLIGGDLKQWDITFSPKFSLEHKALGQFGGGGYD